MLTVTGRMIRLPRRMAARPPWMATGTIGAPALIAMMKPPFLNGSISSVSLRVPSGKIRNELPARSDRAPASIDRIADSFLLRSIGMKPPIRNARARTGMRSISCL